MDICRCRSWPRSQVLLAEPDHHSLHVFGRSPVLHQEVNHAFRFDHQVAAEEEDPEHDGERQDAQHGDLHHARDEEFALILQQHQGPSTVAGHHVVRGVTGERLQSPGEALAAVEQRVVRRVEEGNVHVSVRVTSQKTRGSSRWWKHSLDTKPALRGKRCLMWVSGRKPTRRKTKTRPRSGSASRHLVRLQRVKTASTSERCVKTSFIDLFFLYSTQNPLSLKFSRSWQVSAQSATRCWEQQTLPARAPSALRFKVMMSSPRRAQHHHLHLHLPTERSQVALDQLHRAPPSSHPKQTK